MTELDRRVEELANKQHGLFTTRQVLLLNGTHRQLQHRVATGRWVRVSFGVLRLLGAPSTPQQHLLGMLLARSRAAVVSHRSAAWLHGLPGYGPEPYEITVPTGSQAAIVDGIIHRSNRLPAYHRTVIDGVPTSTLARVLLELTAVVRIGRAARSMDSALAERRVRYEDLIRILDDVRARGRRRTQVFRMLLAERGPLYVPPASELERRFARLLENAELDHWDRQVDVGGDDRWLGRVDFLHRGARVVVEVDGHAAHSSFLDRKADAARDAAMVAAGLTVLRFGWAEIVGDPTKVVSRIRAQLATAP